ncbi:uncharacterized protein LOC106649504 isoform X1 [Trichogramma pretiosum]|uniref:uncharacterized protein LOC106649504 isoform X1 n=1 Tax=Trichogramma pretiosum TaxID=7493 RepID=UPI000C718A44|nr:uncharacterized protein LOC106649504 isoform X1 [Trichogramma pretiosum]
MAIVNETLIPLMKKDNKLFETIFNRIAFGGSYYKGTKYGSPNEFDLYLVHKLDHWSIDLVIDTNHNKVGYVKIKINYRGGRDPNCLRYKEELKKITDSNDYLDQNKFRSWLESVIMSAFNTLRRGPSGYELYHGGRTYYMRHKKSGPAFTIMIGKPNGDDVFDVDLVPCIEFNGVQLSSGYKRYNEDKRPFRVVPKPLYGSIWNDNLLWRLSFSENEKAMLNKSGAVKSIIKLMKKFRDTHDLKSIVSYYMETIFFHELENHKKDLDQFVRGSKTWLFMHGLRKLKEALEKEKLPFFWHSGLNLFEKMSSATMQNHANRIRNIIDEIDDKMDSDQLILARKILTAHESNYLIRANFRVVYQNYNNRYYNRRRKDDNEFNNMILVFFIILIIWMLNQDQSTSSTT